MSIQQDQKIESKDEERDIVRYLRDHPDFFERHQDLLADMLLPHETGSAISLVERQVSVLRDQRDEYKKKLQQLVKTAQQNEKLNNHVNALILALLDAESLDEVLHTHGTSGTTGRPTAFGIGFDDWHRIANAHARIMWGCGIRPSDMIFIGSFFSLYMGSWGALVGGERLRAKCFPFGAGVPGQSVMGLRWIKDMQPTVFTVPHHIPFIWPKLPKEKDTTQEGIFILGLCFSLGNPGQASRRRKNSLRRPMVVLALIRGPQPR